MQTANPSYTPTAATVTNNNDSICTAALGPPTPKEHETVLDTGSSGNYFGINAPLDNVKLNPHPIQVRLPDHSHMTSTHTGELPIPELPSEARLCHLFPALEDMSLLLIGQLCDAGCIAHFNADTAHITNEDQIILQGKRDATTNKLWHLVLPSSQNQLRV